MRELTPAALGPFTVPPVNLRQHFNADNVNMVTCGGQATIPIVAAIGQVVEVEYAEIVAKKGKAIIILNPGEPPIIMRDTIHALVKEAGKEQQIYDSILKMVKEVQKYVPGYRLRGEPIFQDNKISVFLEVEGAGDYFPNYSGNLDIMTAAAARVANEMAKNMLVQGESVV